jgi:hypothetical protein
MSKPSTYDGNGGLVVSEQCTVQCTLPLLFRARVLKHLLEAEKSTFRGELSF